MSDDETTESQILEALQEIRSTLAQIHTTMERAWFRPVEFIEPVEAPPTVSWRREFLRRWFT